MHALPHNSWVPCRTKTSGLLVPQHIHQWFGLGPFWSSPVQHLLSLIGAIQALLSVWQQVSSQENTTYKCHIPSVKQLVNVLLCCIALSSPEKRSTDRMPNWAPFAASPSQQSKIFDWIDCPACQLPKNVRQRSTSQWITDTTCLAWHYKSPFVGSKNYLPSGAHKNRKSTMQNRDAP